MLILVLIEVQYSQKAVFTFEKGLNCQSHSSGSLQPVKNSPSKTSDSPLTGEEFHPTSYHYLENPHI